MNEFDAVRDMIDGLSKGRREKIMERYDEIVVKFGPTPEDLDHWVGKSSFNLSIGMKVLVERNEDGTPRLKIVNEDVEIANVNTNIWLSDLLEERTDTEEKIIMQVAFLTAAACNCLMMASALGAPIDELLEFFVHRLAKDVKGLSIGHGEGPSGGRPWEQGGKGTPRQKEEETDKIMFG
jgi:hypothetical protein